jgi:hypothetical protein
MVIILIHLLRLIAVLGRSHSILHAPAGNGFYQGGTNAEVHMPFALGKHRKRVLACVHGARITTVLWAA